MFSFNSLIMVIGILLGGMLIYVIGVIHGEKSERKRITNKIAAYSFKLKLSNENLKFLVHLIHNKNELKENDLE